VQEAARPVTAGTRVVAATRGWLLPYLLIAVVCMVELLTSRRVIVGGFLVLAPLLASRLSTRRSQVIAVGLVTLVAATALGLYTSSMAGGQLFIRLLLITLATLFALVNWGAAQREQSALERAADTISMAGALAAGLEPEEAYNLLARSARTLFAANTAAVYRRQGDQMVTVAQARDPEVPAMPLRLPRRSFPAAFMTVARRVSVRASTEPEAPMLEARGLNSLLWLPLLDRAGEQLGTIVLAWKRDPKLSAQALEASESFAGSTTSIGAGAIKTPSSGRLRRVCSAPVGSTTIPSCSCEPSRSARANGPFVTKTVCSPGECGGSTAAIAHPSATSTFNPMVNKATDGWPLPRGATTSPPSTPPTFATTRLPSSTGPA
jgi:hypothetical protein